MLTSHNHEVAVVCVVSTSLYFAIAIVGSLSGVSCCGVQVALGGKNVMVAKILIEDVSTLLLMIKELLRKTNKHALDCNYK